jgi:DMSO/TMAO reductase YedYZ molybdopterin-dependent catalytic subunit
MTRASRRTFLEKMALGALAAAPSARDADAGPWSLLGSAGSSRRAGSEDKGRLIGTLPFLGEGDLPLEATVGAGLGQRRAVDLARIPDDGPLVPAERFFVRTGVPGGLPGLGEWKIRLHGLARTPREVEVGELEREARDQGVHLLECAGNSRNLHFGLMSVARWRGVPLEGVLDRVVPRDRASQLLVSGFDGHAVQDAGSVPGASWIFPLDRIRRSGAFLATSMNGAPLRPEHGFPLRLVVPGWYGCVAIKWVNEIAFVDDTAPATDHMREYAGRTHQEPAGPRDDALMRAGRRPEGPPSARDFQPATIDPAAVPVRVEKRLMAGQLVHRVVGIRWGGREAASGSRLLVRFRPGEKWVPVVDPAPVVSNSWSVWSHLWKPARPGRYLIELRLEGEGVRTRRLDAGYYGREVAVGQV